MPIIRDLLIRQYRQSHQGGDQKGTLGNVRQGGGIFYSCEKQCKSDNIISELSCMAKCMREKATERVKGMTGNLRLRK